jgi:isoleucyl-tRNA synthetase
LNAAEYYIKQHSWKLAQIEVMQLIGKNPEILARKQQEMIMMGDMRNPLMALKEEIQQDKISELSQVYDLDKIKRDHSVFKSLYAGVNQLYNARVEYIDASARAAASTSSSALPMAAPSAGKKLAPSRKQ